MLRSSRAAFRFAILSLCCFAATPRAPAQSKTAAPSTAPGKATTPAQTTTPGKTAAPAATPSESQLFGWLAELDRSLPTTVDGYRKLDVPKFVLACNSVDQWSAELARFANMEQPDRILENAGYLIISKQRVDAALERVMDQRGMFADPKKREIDDERRIAIVNFLQATTALNDLTARLRYLHRDALETAADLLAESRPQYTRFVELLAKYQSTIGAAVMAEALLDPAPGNPDGLIPLTPDLKRSVIAAISSSGATELLDILVDVVKATGQPSSIRLAAAQAIMQIGLPQQIRAGTDPTLPKPAITPAQLHEQIRKIPTEKFDATQRKSYDELLAAVTARMKSGLTEDVMRIGRYEIRPGDWMLMRNPSPYNMFTDLSPGLFTHVGVAAMETGPDGIRRMVIVDLPERGSTIPATNVEIYLQRTLHYAFLRHPDPKIAAILAQAATDCIGNPSEFDLNFRTDRVAALAKKPLRGEKIHTYCAGFLLVGSQRTGLPRSEFFPIAEHAPADNVPDNFKQLGLSFGDDFISPTGAFFSPKLKLVARRESMYDPRREIEEAVFDHFALRCRTGKLVQSPDFIQSLRSKVAEASASNPLLATALASAANVGSDIDLVSAAKAAAVVEALDEVAFGNSAKYFNARTAIIDGPNPPAVEGRTPEQVAMLKTLRAEHADIAARWDANRMTPRQLRVELVNFYSDAGRKALDARLFPGSK